MHRQTRKPRLLTMHFYYSLFCCAGSGYFLFLESIARNLFLVNCFILQP